MSDTGFLLAWCGRLLVLSLLSSAVIFGIGAVGVFDHLSDGVSGLVGITLGWLCVGGAFYWTDRSDA